MCAVVILLVGWLGFFCFDNFFFNSCLSKQANEECFCFLFILRCVFSVFTNPFNAWKSKVVMYVLL